MKKSFAIVALTLLMPLLVFAQLKVATNGYVGILNATPASMLSINGTGYSQYTATAYNITNVNGGASLAGITTGSTSGYWRYGVSGSCSVLGSGNAIGLMGSAYTSTVLTQGRAYGVYGYAGNATSGYNYGVYGTLNGSNNGAAVYGVISSYSDNGINGKYAGYFLGPVYMNTQLTIGTQMIISGTQLLIGYTSSPYAMDIKGIVRADVIPLNSDGRLKENIQDMNGSLASLGKLRGVSYKLKPNGMDALKGNNVLKTHEKIITEKSDTSKYIQQQPEKKLDTALYNRNHMGFIAQELQKVFPELVYEDNDGVLSVDYISLIPILVEAMKEQQGQFSKLSQELETLKQENEKLKKKVGLK